MMNNTLIENAVTLASRYSNIDKNELRVNVINWYNNTDFTSDEVLAALAIEGSYKKMSFSDIDKIILAFKMLIEYDEYYNNFSIEEIEMAQNDYLFTL